MYPKDGQNLLAAAVKCVLQNWNMFFNFNSIYTFDFLSEAKNIFSILYKRLKNNFSDILNCKLIVKNPVNC